MFALATVSLTSTASVIEFSEIPSSYTHLQLRAIVRTNRSAANDGDVVYMSFNGDTGNNYVSHRLEGNGSSASAAYQAATSYMVFNRFACESAASTTFGTLITDILDYTSTSKNKTVRALCGFDNNGTGLAALDSGMWFATPTKVTSIKLVPGGGTAFSANSHFALYGIKAG
jgi:hypothetical protein